MKRRYFIRAFTTALALTAMLYGCSSVPLQPWHSEELTEEFSEDRADEVTSFADYLELEDRLFRELDEMVYAQTETGPEYRLDRYSAGSAVDPRDRAPDWNRSFEFTLDNPKGAVLLLHGMSDSPYALRTLGRAMSRHGFRVLGMRLPGHGTAPSGLRHVRREDMTAAVRIGMRHLGEKMQGRPVHILGYSNGAALAVEFALDALEGKVAPVPASLVLVSPAMGIHPSAGLASFKDWLGNLPGLSGLAFLQIYPEFDPYKYNSFATNAGDVVHRITRDVARRVKARASSNPDVVLPPIIAFKSTVDATVSTDAVVDNLLARLKPDRHELVLFDINRYDIVKSHLIIADPAPLTDRVMADAQLPFAVTLVTNESERTTSIVSQRKEPFSAAVSSTRPLDLAWPPGVISLSHVALPFAPDDPVYGQRKPENSDFIFLGQISVQGERGLINIPMDWITRIRYNPFYDYLEQRTLDWINAADDGQ